MPRTVGSFGVGATAAACWPRAGGGADVETGGAFYTLTFWCSEENSELRQEIAKLKREGK